MVRSSVCRSNCEQSLDGAAFVYCFVSVGGLFEGHGEVENFAGIDFALPDELDQFGQEAAHGCRASEHVNCGEKQLFAGQIDAVSNTDIAYVASGTGRTDRLHHRFLGSDGLNDRMRTQTAGEFFDSFHTGIAALDDNVRGTELQGELLSGFVAGHRDDTLRTKLLGRHHGQQANSPITDHDDRFARSCRCRHSTEPPGAKHV